MVEVLTSFMETQVIFFKTAAGIIYWDNNRHLVEIIYDQNAEIKVADTRELLNNLEKFSSDKVKLLSDIRQVNSVSKEARVFCSSPEFSKKIQATAVIVDGIHTRLMVNFFINFNKPTFPLKVFNNHEEAITWLDQL